MAPSLPLRESGATNRAPTPGPRILPAYLQIEDELAEQIERGDLAPGARLATERELSERFGVSRMTLRAALARLAHRGLIDRRQGSGTFVAEPKLRHDAAHLSGFFAETAAQGVLPVTALLDRSEIGATPRLAEVLELRPGDPVYRIVRLRSARRVPVVLETSFFPAFRVPGLLELDLERSSVYRLMEEHFRARPVRGVQSLEPITAEPAEAALLEVEPGNALMLVERTAWDVDGRPVEHARDLYRGDRSRFVTELTL